MEQATPSNGACRYFLQIVSGRKIVGCQFRRLQSSTITIDFHLIGMRETGFLQEIGAQLVDASLWNPYFDPCTVLQNGMSGITRTVSCSFLNSPA